ARAPQFRFGRGAGGYFRVQCLVETAQLRGSLFHPLLEIGGVSLELALRLRELRPTALQLSVCADGVLDRGHQQVHDLLLLRSDREFLPEKDHVDTEGEASRRPDPLALEKRS